MKKFQNLLAKENNYELREKIHSSPSIPSTTQNNEVTDENKNPQISQTVMIYLKTSDNRAHKITSQKTSKISMIKRIIQERFNILQNDQIIYLNGKQISAFSTIKLRDKEILHISNKKTLPTQKDFIEVSLKVMVPQNVPSITQTYQYRFRGEQKLIKLKDVLQQNVLNLLLSEQNYQITFIESSRILNLEKTFTQNQLVRKCEIICILSENNVQTKFQNEVSMEGQEEQKLNIQQSSNDNIEQSHQFTIDDQETVTQQSQKSINFKKKPIISSKNFLVKNSKQSSLSGKLCKNTYTSAQQYTNSKIQSDSTSYEFSTQSFKKKKISFKEQEQKNRQDKLLKKIIVHKNKKQIQKILAQNSLLKENNEKQKELQDQKSVVSSSSSQQRPKILNVKQKQHRPFPLIPQRKMPQSQKMKINMQLQRLFCQDVKLFSSNSSTNKNEQNENIQKETETIIKPKSSTSQLLRNNNMRTSISSRESLLRGLAEKRSNRYSEQKMCQDD